MKYIIGVDSGGTKTLGVCFDKEGAILQESRSGFGNFSVSETKTIDHITEVLDDLTKRRNKEEISLILVGIAGYTKYTQKDYFLDLLRHRYGVPILAVTDAEIALYSVKRDSDLDVMMILGGTGSVVMVNDKNGVRFIGGFGHLLGDEGSGYHLAITELKHIISQFEQAKPITVLSQAVLAEIQARDYQEIKSFVYGNTKDTIARLSEFIASHAINGNQEAIQLFVNEGELLAKQAITAYQSIQTDKTVRVGMKGGFLLHAPYVRETLIKELEQAKLKFTMDESIAEPITGAYYLAMEHLGER